MDRRRWAQERRRKDASLHDDLPIREKPSTEATISDVDNAPIPQRSTVRAVTPDGQLHDIVPAKTTQNFEASFIPTGASPVRTSRIADQEQESPRIQTRNLVGRKPSTDSSRRTVIGSPTSSEHGSGHSRRKTITIHGPIEEGPLLSSSVPLTRSRNSSAQFDDASDASEQRNPIANAFQRLPSSFSQPLIGLRNERASSPPRSPANFNFTLPTPNARKILYLMKTLAGRMSGNVTFRETSKGQWVNVYCFIREGEGSLMCESDFGQGPYNTLVADLRGCQVNCHSDDETGTPFISLLIPRSAGELHLRFTTQTDLDSWYAALLCWQPMQPRAMRSRLPKPQTARLSARATAPTDSKQGTETAQLREAPVIKVGQMILWELDGASKSPITAQAPSRSATPRSGSVGGHRIYGFRWWKRVSSTLRENGELRLYTESDNQLVSTIHLSQLSRAAIQRLDPSVLDQEYSIAVCPQYTYGTSDSDRQRNIYLSFDTSVLFEVWFVLLRAFTIPQLYGPKPSDDPEDEAQGPADKTTGIQADMFRMERGLSICVLEARLHHVERLKSTPDYSAQFRRTNSPKYQTPNGYYVEIHLDGESRGKTLVKQSETNPFWSQEFEYLDLPAVLSSASVHLKQRQGEGFFGRKDDSRSPNEPFGAAQDPKESAALSGYTGYSQDVTIGKVEITLEELDTQKKSEQWCTIMNALDQDVGTLLIRARAEEVVILMRDEYEPLHQLLHAFENGITVQIFTHLSTELKRLSDAFVNVFQVSGRSTDWLMALIEDEVDGHGKDGPLSKARFSQRHGSAEPDPLIGSPSGEREMVVRDMHKNAALEANLLFRGNTLLTKALDTHMRRVGAEYLQASLGATIQAIHDRDPECEVDPNRCSDKHEVQKNWQRLLAVTADVWESIRSSVKKCPVDLRYILRHIKACAEDKYGDFLRSVRYSSVSGFLFLRFFCPAVLSPKLFGLLKDDPKPKAKRTFVLVAKSLQTLANMATFGSKEAWMEPMNAFLTSNRDSFKHFIEEICSVPPNGPISAAENLPSYSTPTAIRNRLPATSKEGFPSLPFLLDQGREYANLVDIWLQHCPRAPAEGTPLATFDGICRALHARTQLCLARAERSDAPPREERSPSPPQVVPPEEDYLPALPVRPESALSVTEEPRRKQRGGSRRGSAEDGGRERQGFLELVGWGGKRRR